MIEIEQIQEMAKDLRKAEFWTFDDFACEARLDEKHTAESLYAKGYRKASEVARETIEEAIEVARHIFDEAKTGDEVAKELVDELGSILGAALSNLACVVNPQSIVIGGGVSKAGDILIETIQEHFKENAFHALKETEFGIATLGNDAGIYGCVAMILA